LREGAEPADGFRNPATGRNCPDCGYARLRRKIGVAGCFIDLAGFRQGLIRSAGPVCAWDIEAKKDNMTEAAIALQSGDEEFGGWCNGVYNRPTIRIFSQYSSPLFSSDPPFCTDRDFYFACGLAHRKLSLTHFKNPSRHPSAKPQAAKKAGLSSPIALYRM